VKLKLYKITNSQFIVINNHEPFADKSKQEPCQ